MDQEVCFSEEWQVNVCRSFTFSKWTECHVDPHKEECNFEFRVTRQQHAHNRQFYYRLEYRILNSNNGRWIKTWSVVDFFHPNQTINRVIRNSKDNRPLVYTTELGVHCTYNTTYMLDRKNDCIVLVQYTESRRVDQPTRTTTVDPATVDPATIDPATDNPATIDPAMVDPTKVNQLPNFLTKI